MRCILVSNRGMVSYLHVKTSLDDALKNAYQVYVRNESKAAELNCAEPSSKYKQEMP